MRWAGKCNMHGGDENCIQSLVVKPEGKRSLRRSKHMWRIILKWILRKQCRRLWTG
jgi:hypothetical protein